MELHEVIEDFEKTLEHVEEIEILLSIDPNSYPENTTEKTFRRIEMAQASNGMLKNAIKSAMFLLKK